MAKIFTYEGSYSSFINSLGLVERDRNAAIAHAFQGDYHLAIIQFRRTCKAVPRLPQGYKTHADILQEIKYGMMDSFQRSFEYAVKSHYDAMLDIVARAKKGENVDELFNYAFEEHARDMERFANLSSQIMLADVIIDNMCSTGVMSDARLNQVESMFAEPAPEST